jgi:hypothetical protein
MIARAFSGSLVDPSVRSVNRICRLGVNKGMCVCVCACVYVLCVRAGSADWVSIKACVHVCYARVHVCACVRVFVCVCVYAQAHKKHNKGNV